MQLLGPGSLQSSAIIMRSNILRYCINNCRNWGRTTIRCWIHKTHPTPHPNRGAMGSSLLICLRKLKCYNGTVVYMDWYLQVWDRHYKDYTVVRPSFLSHNENRILVRQHLYIDTAPWWLKYKLHIIIAEFLAANFSKLWWFKSPLLLYV